MAAPDGAASQPFMTGASSAAADAAHGSLMAAARPSGLLRPAARPFLHPVSSSLPAVAPGSPFEGQNHVYGVSPLGSQAPPMTAPAMSGMAVGPLMAAPAVGGASNGWGAPRTIGTPSVRPSAAAPVQPGRGPAAPSRVDDGAAQSPGLPTLRSFARRGPVDDADEDDEENCFSVEGDHSYTPCAGRGTTQRQSMTGSDSTLPTNKKRRSRAVPRRATGVPTTPHRGDLPAGGGGEAGGPARGAGANDTGTMSGVTGAGMSHARQADNGRNTGLSRDAGAPASAFPLTRRAFSGPTGATPPARPATTVPAATTAGRSQACLTTSTQLTELTRTVSAGLAGVRREVTAQRKEVAIMNCQLRSVTKKVDDVAVLADRLTSSLFYQRRAVINMAGDVSTVLARTSVRSAAEVASVVRPSTAIAPVAEGHAINVEANTMEAQVQEAQWILELKVSSWCSSIASRLA